MVDQCQTFLSGIQSKILEQELQEQLARAYYLLVAQETSYVNHTLSVKGLVSKLQIIAERVKAFHTSNVTSSPVALISDAKATEKNYEGIEGDIHIDNDKGEPFLNMEHFPYEYCAVNREMGESYDLKRNTCQNEGYNFDETKTRVCITEKASTPTRNSQIDARLQDNPFYACSTTCFYVDTRNPSSVMNDMCDGSIKEVNDISTAAATEVPLTESYSKVGHNEEVLEIHPEKNHKLRQSLSTAAFIETIHSLFTGGDAYNEVGVDHVVHVDDCTSRAYSIIGETEHRCLVAAPSEPSLSCPTNQLEKAGRGITNTMAMSSVEDHKYYNRLPGSFCNVTSSGNAETCAPTEVLQLQYVEKERLFAKDAESCTGDNQNPASVDQACEGKIGNPSQQLRQFLPKNRNACDSTTLMPYVASVAWGHTNLRHSPFKGAVMREPQGLTDSFPLATAACMTPSKAVKSIHGERRYGFSVSPKAEPGVNQGKLNVNDISPQFVFWPGLQISNLFLPVAIATRLDKDASDVSSTLSLALRVRQKDLTAIIEACFPPYLTHLTPDRVHAFHDALRESLSAVRTSSSGGSASILALQEEEEAWAARGPELWRHAAEVAASLLTLLPPVLQGLQGAASIPFDGLSAPDGAISDIIDFTIEAKEGFHSQFDGCSALNVGSVQCWRRYWCRRLYELLHEARRGLEIVCEFDTRWPSTLHRLMEKQYHKVELARPGSYDFSFPTSTPSPSSSSTMPRIFKPECACMEAAVQISGFDSESCCVFLHDLGAPGCFTSLLLALTEDGNDDGGWVSGTDGSKSETQMIYIGTDVTTVEELPPSCPGCPLSIEHVLDSKERSVVVKVQIPPRVIVERLQSDLIYLDSLL